MKAALVITSISPPNHVLRACAAGCREHGIDFIVIGDRKSPPDFHLDGCDYWSIERQLESHFKIARLLPEGHYSRKNLGYLIAMERGAEVIIETDDDNLPLESFWEKRRRVHQSRRVSAGGWVNPYGYFTDDRIWPRGFPLEEIGRPSPAAATASADAPIQQGLADGDPDVDAIYRLTRNRQVTFRRELPLALGAGAISPFNSQNTTWFCEAFPLLYLPSTCSFRMTDIWRSFVAQRICRANGWEILFHAASVFQERNPHDLMADFRDELTGYLHNADICRGLAELDLRGGSENLSNKLVQCYEFFVAKGFVVAKEISLLHAWISDISAINVSCARHMSADRKRK